MAQSIEAPNIDTTMAQRQVGGIADSFSTFTTVRALTSGTGALSTGTRAGKPAGAALNDLYHETDTLWTYYWTGTQWQFLAGTNSGTNATRAAITVTAKDNGATFITSDTRAVYQVSSGAWVLRLTTRLDKLNATVTPTVNEDSGDGYEVGSVWIDVTADDAYVCVDSTVAAAVWKKTTP